LIILSSLYFCRHDDISPAPLFTPLILLAMPLSSSRFTPRRLHRTRHNNARPMHRVTFFSSFSSPL